MTAPDEVLSKLQRRRRRKKAQRRVAGRKGVGCPRPDKAAYNPDDSFERKLQERALGPGMEMYNCRCGFSHNGHPVPRGPRHWTEMRV